MGFSVEKIAVIILDPPRAGIAPKTLDRVIALKSEKIVYVSCNPATLARDAGALNELGYKMLKVGVMDMFPHTTHVESIAVFEPKQ